MIKKFFHFLVFAIETAALSVVVLYLIFAKIDDAVADRTFAQEGDRLQFKFTPGQDVLLNRIRAIRIYYTSADNPQFGEYYKTKSSAILSDEFAFNVELDSNSPDKAYVVDIPKGLFDFRMDFYFKEAHPERCEPPHLMEMSVGDRKVNLGQLRAGFFDLEPISFPFYMYNYIPLMGGYVFEFILACVALWAVIMATIVFYVSRQKGTPR